VLGNCLLLRFRSLRSLFVDFPLRVDNIYKLKLIIIQWNNLKGNSNKEVNLSIISVEKLFMIQDFADCKSKLKLKAEIPQKVLQF